MKILDKLQEIIEEVTEQKKTRLTKRLYCNVAKDYIDEKPAIVAAGYGILKTSYYSYIKREKLKQSYEYKYYYKLIKEKIENYLIIDEINKSKRWKIEDEIKRSDNTIHFEIFYYQKSNKNTVEIKLSNNKKAISEFTERIKNDEIRNLKD